MRPGDEVAVIRQELKLHHEQQEDRRDHECDPCDRPQQRAESAFTKVRWAGEKLDENVARQLPPETVTNCGVLAADLIAEHLIEPFRLVGQHHEMHQRIGVDDEEKDRREEKKGEQRQFYVKEWELDRLFEEKICVRNGAGRDRKIEQHEQIGER